MTIELKSITVDLSGVEVLRGVSMSLDTGVTALVGRNGAGKTTLIRTICGLVSPTSGAVLRDGVDVSRDRDRMVEHRQGLGWLPQDSGVPPRMRVESLVSYAAWLKKIPVRDRPGSIDSALTEVGLLDLRRQRLGHMSGGQRRRASLAAAIVGRPGLLVLDEPTSGFDPVQREHFLVTVRALAADRIVLLSTHLLEDVALVADSWWALESGLVTASGVVDRSSPERATACMEDIRSAMAERENFV